MLNTFSLLLLPLSTLLCAGSSDWLEGNFSTRAATAPAAYWSLVLWGLLTGGYFLVLLSRLTAPLFPLSLRLSLLGLILSGGSSLFCSVIIPYLPHRFPGWAHFHVTAAALSSVLLMGVLLVLILLRLRHVPARRIRLIRGWTCISALSLTLLWAAGMVTTALEVCFTLSTILLARMLWLWQD